MIWLALQRLPGLTIIFNHSESFSELSIADMTGVKRFWVDAAKSFYHLTGFENVLGVVFKGFFLIFLIIILCSIMLY